jgi:hypothetical protein
MRTGARSLLGGRANFRPEIVVGSRIPCLAFSENMGFLSNRLIADCNDVGPGTLLCGTAHLTASPVFPRSSSREAAMAHNAEWSNVTARRCQKAISEFLNLFTSPRPVHDPILQVGTRPLASDPIAKAVRCLYIGETEVKTPEELIKEAHNQTTRGEPDVAGLPANPAQLHEHLVKIACALQTRYWFADEERITYGMSFWEYMEISVPGYIRTEYWESVQTGQGLWAFTAFRTRRRENDRDIIWRVWWKVYDIEKLAETVDEPLSHAPKEDEDPEVRQAVETLYREVNDDFVL